MAQDDPIIQMVGDPDFPKMSLPEQQKALTAHDPMFGNMDPMNITAFVQAHQAARTPGMNPLLAAQGYMVNPQAQAQAQVPTPAQVMGPAGGNERNQTEAMRSARRALTGKAIMTGANTLPVAGMAVGGALGSEVPGAGNVVGAGLGGAAGEAAKRGLLSMMGQQQPAPFSGQNLKDLGMAGATGATGEMGGQIIGKGIEAAAPVVGRAISRLAGVPEATAKYGEDVAAQEEAIRQRGIGKRQNIAKYQEAQTDLASANEAKQAQYQSDLAAAKAKIPPAPPGQQELWVDLNKSLQVSPNKIRVKLGAPDLDAAVSMPGRGLAQEGLKAADLAKMSPIEQNAAIAPKWNSAGQAVDATAAKATAAGKTVDLTRVDESVDALQDPNARQGIQKIINRVGKSLGIRGTDWTAATPTQALALRRELWNAGSNGEYVSRSVSQELRNAVPELKDIDQHYSDLNGAMTTVRDNLKKYGTGKFKLPTMTPDLPQAPTPAEFQQPSYKTLAKVPPTPTPPDVTALKKQLGGKVVKGALATAGAGASGRIGYDLYQALKGKSPTPVGQ